MPAVDPKRLKFTINELMTFFDQPAEFLRRLQDLFSHYANRHLHFGDESPTRPLIPVYNLPLPITRQLNLDLGRQCEKNPEAALHLADELWKDNHMEIKQTAIHILSDVPVTEPDSIISRISSWITPKLNKKLISQLFSTGTQKLQENFQEEWEKFIVSFLKEEKPEMIALGLKGLSEGLKNPNFKNLPAVFRLVSPFIRDPHPDYHQSLVQLTSRLIQRSPTETALFLKQMLALSRSSATSQVIKDCLHLFPEELRQELRESIRK